MQARYTSKKERAELFLRQDGKCKCGTKLEKGDTIIEHRIPLAIGGLDVTENKYLNCKACADLKTFGTPATSYGSDFHAIAKIKRIRAKAEGKTKLKRKIPSRPFQQAKSQWPKGRKMQSGKFRKGAQACRISGMPRP